MAIDEFYQIDPKPGEPAFETTVARFLYDENDLYVSIYAYDREPNIAPATKSSRCSDRRPRFRDGLGNHGSRRQRSASVIG